MKEEEIITRLKAIDMWYDVGEQYSLDDLNAIEGILKLYEKQNNKIQKIKQIVDIYNNTNREFATLPNGEEICLSDNEPIIAYLQEILEEEN